MPTVMNKQPLPFFRAKRTTFQFLCHLVWCESTVSQSRILKFFFLIPRKNSSGDHPPLLSSAFLLCLQSPHTSATTPTPQGHFFDLEESISKHSTSYRQKAKLSSFENFCRCRPSCHTSSTCGCSLHQVIDNMPTPSSQDWYRPQRHQRQRYAGTAKDG